MSDTTYSPGVLALELSAGAAPAAYTLNREQADVLARHIADDLARLLPALGRNPGVEQADLLVLGALYDAAQVLRPGWPLWAQLAELVQHGQLLQGAAERRIVAFGSADGLLPAPLAQPQPERVPGALLLLPWTLAADAATADALGARMENVFMASGEAGSATADFLMRALDMPLEHARYLTRHDLCALTCAQMEHAGFSALWQMLEFALLYPEREGEAETSRGRRLEFRNGQVHCELPRYADWVAAQGQDLDAAERAQGYAGWLFELRQCAALLAAHGLALQVDGGDGDAVLPLQLLTEADPALPPAQLYAHEARGLGVVVVTAAQIGAQGQERLLAHAWPLDRAGLDAAVAQLSARFDAQPELVRLGQLGLDPAGAGLSVVAAAPSLH